MEAKPKKGIRRNKTLVFFIFFLISLLIWIITALSASYKTVIPLKLDYVGLQDDRILLGEPPNQLGAQVESSGFRVLGSRLYPKTLLLNTVLARKKGRDSYFLREELVDMVNRQYPQFRSIRIPVDTLSFRMGILAKKKVRVKPRLEVSFLSDHQLVDSLRIEPESVMLIGPEDVLEPVKEVYTVYRAMKNVQQDISLDLDIVLPDSLQQLKVSPGRVHVKGIVKRYTEQVVEVPVSLVNAPEKTKIRLFPETVRLRFKAPLEEIKRLDPQSFKVVADFNTISDRSPYLLLQVTDSPAFVQQVHLMDAKVEYLIRRL